MVSLHTCALCALASFGFMTPVAAESAVDVAPTVAAVQGPGGKITVPGQLTAGGEANVSYSNPNKPNQIIVIQVDDGDGNRPQEIVIETDDAGNGSTIWTVPGWDIATFDGPDAGAVTKFIY